MTDTNTISGINSTQGSDTLFLRRYPPMKEASELVIVCRPDNYSAERISQAVEDCDAHVVNLNLTGERTDDGNLVIDLRVNCANAETIARSLSRYGYEVDSVSRPPSAEDEQERMRALEILRLLEV